MTEPQKTPRNSPETRAKISATNKAIASDPEWRAAISRRQLGKPSRGGHITNHKNRGRFKESCVFCQQEASGE